MKLIILSLLTCVIMAHCEMARPQYVNKGYININ